MKIWKQLFLVLTILGLLNISVVTCEQPKSKDESWTTKYFGLSPKETAAAAAVTVTAAVAAPVVATGALGLVGFSAGGVVAGSLAATAQAALGNVVGGSIFAGLQSLAATGGFAVLGKLSVAAGAMAGGTFYTATKSSDEDSKNK